mmetsp:Transcript_63997/g.187776  ORF Transcript_63997/g.187776 Transcript_63997/m.187776 type:complete len:1190 (+) Transcript_63997:117-3686(+)
MDAIAEDEKPPALHATLLGPWTPAEGADESLAESVPAASSFSLFVRLGQQLAEDQKEAGQGVTAVALEDVLHLLADDGAPDDLGFQLWAWDDKVQVWGFPVVRDVSRSSWAYARGLRNGNLLTHANGSFVWGMPFKTLEEIFETGSRRALRFLTSPKGIAEALKCAEDSWERAEDGGEAVKKRKAAAKLRPSASPLRLASVRVDGAHDMVSLALAEDTHGNLVLRASVAMEKRGRRKGKRGKRVEESQSEWTKDLADKKAAGAPWQVHVGLQARALTLGMVFADGQRDLSKTFNLPGKNNIRYGREARVHLHALGGAGPVSLSGLHVPMPSAPGDEGSSSEEELQDRACHVLFLVDLSRSMETRDVHLGGSCYSRIKAVSMVLMDFLTMDAGADRDRYSLVTFADCAATVFDVLDFEGSLERLDSWYPIPKGGTSFAAALRGLRGCTRLYERTRVILLTDGCPGDEYLDEFNDYITYRRGNRGVLPFDSFQLYPIGLGSLQAGAVAKLQQLAALGNGTFQRVDLSLSALRMAFKTVSKTMTALRRVVAEPRSGEPTPATGERWERKPAYEAPLQFRIPPELFQVIGRAQYAFDGESFTVEETSVRAARRRLPFQRGAMRQVFCMLEGERRMVAKLPRWQVAGHPPCAEEDEREAAMFAKSSAVADYFAELFCKCTQLPRSRLGFVKACVYRFREPEEVAVGEEVLDGEFVKYNGNDGFVNELHTSFEAQSFLHFTYEASGRKMMVTDIQGILRQEHGGDAMYMLSDPQVLSQEQEFGAGDLGPEAMQRCLENHRCNHLCQRWQKVVGHGGVLRASPPAGAATCSAEGGPKPDQQDRNVFGAAAAPHRVLKRLDLSAVAATPARTERCDAGPEGAQAAPERRKKAGRAPRSGGPPSGAKTSAARRSARRGAAAGAESPSAPPSGAEAFAARRSGSGRRAEPEPRRGGEDLGSGSSSRHGAAFAKWVPDAAALAELAAGLAPHALGGQAKRRWLWTWQRLPDATDRVILLLHLRREGGAQGVSRLLQGCRNAQDLRDLMSVLALPWHVVCSVAEDLVPEGAGPCDAYVVLLCLQGNSKLADFGQDMRRAVAAVAWQGDSESEDASSDSEVDQPAAQGPPPFFRRPITAGSGEARAEGGKPQPPARCATCGATSTTACGRCRAVRYCSRACQRSHWQRHRGECQGPAAGSRP